jgi:serine/threonine protein kinase
MTLPRSDNEEIFHAAREITDPDQRRKYLETACGGDKTRMALVEALLAASETPDSLLDQPAFGPTIDATRDGPSVADEDLRLDFLEPSEEPGSLGRLGHYEVKEVIGRGGMGIVLRAFDGKLHRVVAIKVMAAQLATSVTARRRFTREAQAAAAVSHDHIVTIHAVEEDKALPYLVMHYVAGLSLQQRLERDGPLELQEILRIGMQTASGLAAAHAQGLVHRDIKPANILLENGVERVKITDFGLARAAADASLTQSGMIAGTPQYMSPEQADGKSVDQRTDLFSLGSVLYAMCTGRGPFRASGTVAVLKRVCEETPTPIRETNPAIPDWLVAIIEKLHAKDPAQRYQSATEVAQLLGRHLAYVQHPSVVGQVPSVPPETKVASNSSPRRRLAIAAAVIGCIIAGVSMTEATGVTSLRATVIRLFTPDGTLVVETNDPGVKVTIEGDGGLVITGAGLEEIRLRPGSYKVHADRDGKPVPLERELVSISKGGREVVNVKLEASLLPVVAKAEKGAFVLLAVGKERKFDNLADAVQHAGDGDTVEIRGNGPFVSDGVKLSRPIVIRAGQGFTPLLTLSETQASKNTPLIAASASLVLEGLDLRVKGQGAKPIEGRWPILLSAHGGAELHVANCRLDSDRLPITSGTSVCSLRNCQLLSNTRAGVDWYPPAGGRCNIANSVIAAGGLSLNLRNLALSDIAITLRDNTIVGYGLSAFRRPDLRADPDSPPLIRWDFSGNVMLCSPVFDRFATLYFEERKDNPLAPGEAEAFIRRLIDLREQGNVFPRGVRMLQMMVDKARREDARGQDLADWDRFWGHEKTGSVEGDIRFQGGNLVTRAHIAPEGITAEDFRLRSDSAGYRASKNGKDIGADVDLVGPGVAYERWKKTPDYQQWLKETRQVKDVKTTAVTPEEVRERQAADVLLRKGASVSLKLADAWTMAVLEKPGQSWPAGNWHVHEVLATRLPALALADLAALRDFPRLRGLNLSGSPVTTAAVMDQIEGGRVAELRLTEVPTTSKDVARIAKLNNLSALYLYGVGLSDDDVAQIATLPLLRDVNVGGNEITDESMKHLARAPLKRLWVSRVKLTDVGLATLHSCKSLLVLDVSRTGVTAEGVANLRKALPNCEVEWVKDAGKGK